MSSEGCSQTAEQGDAADKLISGVRRTLEPFFVTEEDRPTVPGPAGTHRGVVVRASEAR